MRIEYVCRHCNHLVGEINKPGWTNADAERYCGFNQLSEVERMDTIAYNQNNGITYVKTVCDYCQGALESNPALLVEGKLLQ